MILRYALLVDGSSDAVLEPIVRWMFRARWPQVPIESAGVHPRGGDPVDEALRALVVRTGATLVFVHRDAERARWEVRRAEIPWGPSVVGVVPVRMTEAWLLGDERAIRMAAGNPNGTQVLRLPDAAAAERDPDPKRTLRSALLAAAGDPPGRRRQRFQSELARLSHLVAEYTESFDHLRRLAAFRSFEEELARFVGSRSGDARSG